MDPIQFHDHLTIILEKILCLPAAPMFLYDLNQKIDLFLYRNLLK